MPNDCEIFKQRPKTAITNTKLAWTLNKETETELLYMLKPKDFHRSTKNSVRKKFKQLAGNYGIPTPTGSDVTTNIRHRLKFWDLDIVIYTQESHSINKQTFRWQSI